MLRYFYNNNPVRRRRAAEGLPTNQRGTSNFASGKGCLPGLCTLLFLKISNVNIILYVERHRGTLLRLFPRVSQKAKSHQFRSKKTFNQFKGIISNHNGVL